MQVDQSDTQFIGNDSVGKLSVLCRHKQRKRSLHRLYQHSSSSLMSLLRMAQHLKVRQGFLAAGNLVAALQGLGSFAAAVVGACVSFHPLRGLGVVIAVLGAIIATLSGFARICKVVGWAAQTMMLSCTIQKACTWHSAVLPPVMLLTQTRSCKCVLMPVIFWIQIAQ